MLWKVFAPFHDLRLAGNQAFPLKDRAAFAPIPDWLRTYDFALTQLSNTDRQALKACTHGFLSEYETIKRKEKEKN